MDSSLHHSEFVQVELAGYRIKLQISATKILSYVRTVSPDSSDTVLKAFAGRLWIAVLTCMSRDPTERKAVGTPGFAAAVEKAHEKRGPSGGIPSIPLLRSVPEISEAPCETVKKSAVCCIDGDASNKNHPFRVIACQDGPASPGMRKP